MTLDRLVFLFLSINKIVIPYTVMYICICFVFATFIVNHSTVSYSGIDERNYESNEHNI